MRRINRTQSSFSESLFPVFIGSYFLFHHTAYGPPNITLQIAQEQSQRKGS
ncbi:nef attachable domain protein [Chlamydia psittaci C6/98]|nr:nef attachable domain protein [Chlamydia psittaci C6/98]